LPLQGNVPWFYALFLGMLGPESVIDPTWWLSQGSIG